MRARLLAGIGVAAGAALALGACTLPPRVVDEAKVGDAAQVFQGSTSAGSITQLKPVTIRGSIDQQDWSDYWRLDGPSDPYRVQVSCTESPAVSAGLITRIFVPNPGDNDAPYSDEIPCDGTQVLVGPIPGGTFYDHVQLVGAGTGGTYEVKLVALPAS